MRCLVSVWRWLSDYPERDSVALIVWWSMWNRCRWIRWPHLGIIDKDGVIRHFGPVEYQFCYLPPVWFPGRWYVGDYQQMSRLIQAGRQYP